MLAVTPAQGLESLVVGLIRFLHVLANIFQLLEPARHIALIEGRHSESQSLVLNFSRLLEIGLHHLDRSPGGRLCLVFYLAPQPRQSIEGWFEDRSKRLSSGESLLLEPFPQIRFLTVYDMTAGENTEVKYTLH